MAKKGKKKKGRSREALVEQPHKKVRAALKDVMGRDPKSVSLVIETAIPDDDGGWSGNIYKYSF